MSLLIAQFIMCTDLSGNSKCETASSIFVKEPHYSWPSRTIAILVCSHFSFCLIIKFYIGLNNYWRYYSNVIVTFIVCLKKHTTSESKKAFVTACSSLNSKKKGGGKW